MLAHDVKSSQGGAQADVRSSMTGADSRASGAQSARASEVNQSGRYEEVKAPSSKSGSATARAQQSQNSSLGSQPRFGTMAELSHQDSLAGSRGGGTSNQQARNAETMIFTGTASTEEAKRGPEAAQAAAIRPKKQLQKFYDAVLDRQNQNFLYRLVKQSCILQKDDKNKDAHSG